MESIHREVLRKIRELAARAASREIDPLVAARSIDSYATSIGIGLDHPFILLKGIVSQADDIPEPDQLRFWDATSAASKTQERMEFLKQFEDQIIAACVHIRDSAAFADSA